MMGSRTPGFGLATSLPNEQDNEGEEDVGMKGDLLGNDFMGGRPVLGALALGGSAEEEVAVDDLDDLFGGCPIEDLSSLVVAEDLDDLFEQGSFSETSPEAQQALPRAALRPMLLVGLQGSSQENFLAR